MVVRDFFLSVRRFGRHQTQNRTLIGTGVNGERQLGTHPYYNYALKQKYIFTPWSDSEFSLSGIVLF
jgi:hypothetical protein